MDEVLNVNDDALIPAILARHWRDTQNGTYWDILGYIGIWEMKKVRNNRVLKNPVMAESGGI